jgi:hypothetical protein
VFTPRTDVSQFLTGPQDQPLPKQTEPEGVTLRDLVDKAADKGPIQKQTLEDPFLLMKSERWRNGRTVLELIAEVGISRRQLMEWPEETIDRFVAQARENNRNQGLCEPRAYRTFDFDLKLNQKGEKQWP